MLTKQPILIQLAREDEKPFTHEELSLNDFFDIFANELSDERLPKADVAIRLFESVGINAYLNSEGQTMLELKKKYARQYYRNYYADLVDEVKAKNLNAAKDIPKFLRKLHDKYSTLVIIAQRSEEGINFEYFDDWIENLKTYFDDGPTTYLQVINVWSYQ